MRKFIFQLVIGFIGIHQACPSQSLVCDPSKRLKATISSDSMNRLAVAGDRITQIFGDNEAYDAQTEESTGQVFIKPTAENGTKPLSITIITENGLTQDLTLEPATKDAVTVILKTTALATPTLSGMKISQQAGFCQPVAHGFQGMGHAGYGAPAYTNYGFGHIGYSNAGLSIQDQVIQAMKQIVRGDAQVVTIDYQRPDPKNLALGLITAYVVGPFMGLKLDVKNISEEPLDILEKDFVQTGDLAVTFEKRMLAKGESTTCYVVVRV